MDRRFLIEAISCCNLDGINEFLSSGGNINGYFSGLSPLLYAIQCADREPFSPLETPKWNHLQFYVTKDFNFSYDDIILRLIGAGAEVNVKYPYNLMTPLMLALKFKRGNEVIYELIKEGSNVNAECANLKTALFYAVEYNCDLFIVSKLLSRGADVNHQCRFGRTPLVYVLINNCNPELINILINAGADVNLACLEGKTPLMYAIRNNYDKYVIKILINAGADVNHICKSGRTALFYAAAFSEDSEIINILVKSGCCIDVVCPKGKTPLFYAIENNSKNIIKELIQFGANVNHSCKLGRTPLFYAVAISNTEIIMELINAGGNVQICDTFGRNVFSSLNHCDNCTEDSCKNKSIINLLLRYGVDLTLIDPKGNTLIHLVNCKYFISLTIRHGVSIEAKNHYDMTPLMDAVFCSNTLKVNNLLLLNADPNCVTSDLNTLLHYFSTVKSDEIINLLLYHGANLNAVNYDNKTPLDLLLLSICNEDSFLPGSEAVIKHFLLFVLEDGLNDYFHDCDKNNKNEISKIYSIIDECKTELHKMRRLLIKKDLLFYDFCVLKQFYQSKSIDVSVTDYKYNFKQIKGLFPVYQDLIIMRIKDNHYERYKKMLLNSLGKLIVKPYSSCAIKSDVVLNFDCLYCIACYLDNKQLYNLFLCSFMS